MRYSILVWSFLTTFLFIACNQSPDYLPKPRIYPKIEYPEKAYTTFKADYCQFSFQQPKYSVINQNEASTNDRPVNPCWFDIVFPQFDGTIHCTYTSINDGQDLFKVINDSYTLAHKHNKRADYIDELVINNPKNDVYGIVFDLAGSVASPFQFYITDSASHYLRGSLYFNTSPEPDSMNPVIEFVKQDIAMMLNTFKWDD